MPDETMNAMLSQDPAEATPEPDDLVTVRYGDLAQLQQDNAEMGERVQFVFEALVQIMRTLKVAVPQGAMLNPEIALRDYIMPKLETLMRLERQLVETESDLRRRLADTSAPVIDLGGGQKAVQVGRRLPPGFISKEPQR